MLVADRDPLARHVISTTLRGSGQVQSIVAIDASRPLREWQLDRADLVLLSVSPGDEVGRQARALVGRGARVLLLGARWADRDIDAALAAGVAGLLTKDTKPDRLAFAVAAAAVGYTLFSPGLISSATPSQPGRPKAATDPEQHIHGLSDREFEVLSLLATGRSTTEVAGLLDITSATVKSHVSHILGKLKVRNRVEAVLLFQQTASHHGLSEWPEQ
ncbi:response regulator transcription factor [Streptomyces gamaensis]|uniref:Response regulator transcription factor n=1 Tax=Streptomyces gamaensis TaxID=1763542 RepID=A0ABW0YU72_9ACTN